MTLEVFADLLCPWCWISERRLTRAAEDVPADRRRKPTRRGFQMISGLGPEPGATVPEMMLSYLPADEVQARIDRIERIARSEGLDVNLRGTRHVSSLDAHRLIGIADAHGLAAEVSNALFRAHLSEHRAISDHRVLVEIGVAAGMDERSTAAALAGDEGVAQFNADLARAERLRITTIPSLVGDDGRVHIGLRTRGELTKLLDRGRPA